MERVVVDAVVSDSLGLHARVAWRIMQVATDSECHVVLRFGEQTANASSLAELLTLGVQPGQTLRITVEGQRAHEVVSRLREVIESPTPPVVDIDARGQGVLAPGAAQGRVRRVDDVGQDVVQIIQHKTILEKAISTLQGELRSALWDSDMRAVLEASFAILSAEPSDMTRLISSSPPEVRRDVLRRLQRAASTECPVSFQDVVVVGDWLTVADLIPTGKERIVGVCCVRNGPISHAAVYARALGIPMVIVSPQELAAMSDGMQLVISTAEHQALWLDRFAKTAMELPVSLFLDSVYPEEISKGLSEGAAGVGIARLEMLAVTTEIADQSALRQTVERMLDAAAKSPVVFRLPQRFLDDHGTNGAMWLCNHPQLLHNWLKIFSPFAARRNLRFAIPRVENVDAWAWIIAEIRDALPGVPVYAGIESLLGVERLAHLVPLSEGVLLGTGDLAADLARIDRRTEDPREVFWEGRFLRVVKCVTDEARLLGVPLIACGTAAHQLPEAALLVTLGVQALALPVRTVPALKTWCASVDAKEVGDVGRQVLSANTASEAQAVIENWLDDMKAGAV